MLQLPYSLHMLGSVKAKEATVKEWLQISVMNALLRQHTVHMFICRWGMWLLNIRHNNYIVRLHLTLQLYRVCSCQTSENQLSC